MKIINLTQGSPEWLAWRKNGIGSSDIAAICSVCPYRTRTDVMREKLGFGDTFVNAAMQRGKDFEHEARKLYNQMKITDHKPICIEHDEFPYFIASLDGYNEETGGVIEIKIPGEKGWKLAEQGHIPKHYIYQMQWQMMIVGLYCMNYCVYNPDTKKIIIKTIKQDEEILWEITQKAHEFYADLQEGKYEAPKKQTTIEINIEYENILFKMKHIKEMIKTYENGYNECLDILHKRYGVKDTLHGIEYSLIRSERAITDYKAAAEKYCPDLSLFKKEPSICWTLRKNKDE